MSFDNTVKEVNLNSAYKPRKKSRTDRLDLKYKGQMLCEWCNRYTELDPQYFLGQDSKLKDKYEWSDYDLKSWRYYKDLISAVYCNRDWCAQWREEYFSIPQRIVLKPRSRAARIEIPV